MIFVYFLYFCSNLFFVIPLLLLINYLPVPDFQVIWYPGNDDSLTTWAKTGYARTERDNSVDKLLIHEIS